jgi:hypothetical protein
MKRILRRTQGEEAYDSEEVSIQPDEGLQTPRSGWFLFMKFLRRYPRMKFDTSLLLNLFAAAAMLVMGFRSFSKKHQMKFSDDEERAMWEKKFGVFYFFNAVVFAASPFLPHTSIGGSRLLSIGIAADTVFLLMYHAWKKGREDD